MARSKRSDVVDPTTIGVYHCYNRIVRRSLLCGFDPYCGRDYSHRREWLYQRLRYLAEHFAIDWRRSHSSRSARCRFRWPITCGC